MMDIKFVPLKFVPLKMSEIPALKREYNLPLRDAFGNIMDSSFGNPCRDIDLSFFDSSWDTHNDHHKQSYDECCENIVTLKTSLNVTFEYMKEFKSNSTKPDLVLIDSCRIQLLRQISVVEDLLKIINELLLNLECIAKYKNFVTSSKLLLKKTDVNTRLLKDEYDVVMEFLTTS
jgi:hypothetical protein